jgi:oxalate decarboxylase/phosphoglucose isomerase-like protein (cupin superfamily)
MMKPEPIARSHVPAEARRSHVSGIAVGNARFVRPGEVETMMLDWGTIKWLAESRVTGSGIAVGLVILEPGQGHLRHNHPGSEEVLYYVSGEGEQMVEDDDGRPMYRHVTAGDAAYIPAGVYHGTENTGWEPMRLIAIYSPGGPEAIIRAGDDCTTIPAGEIPVRR